MRKLMEQIIKFGIIGVIATIVDWAIFALLVKMYEFGVLGGLTKVIALRNWKVVATVISFTVSVIVNYIGSMKFVFERREDMSRVKEFVIFIILSIIGLGINMLLIFVLDPMVAWFKDWPKFFAELAFMLPKAIATGVLLVLNFVTRKIFLEKKAE